MRIVSWNVDGVVPVLGELGALARELGDPDVLCLQELRIRAADSALAARVATALPGYSCGLALSSDPRNAAFRGGRTYGVATWARARLRPRHTTVPWDREGRVVVTHVGRRVVFNVYAVNGTARPYFDERGEPCGTRYDFKRVFQRRLAGELRAYRERVIAIGDWNVSQEAIDTHPRLRTEEPHALARAELRAIARALELVDAFRALHPERPAYTWFNRRARTLDAARVDFALVPKRLMPRVLAADVLPRRPESDHAPIALVMR